MPDACAWVAVGDTSAAEDASSEKTSIRRMLVIAAILRIQQTNSRAAASASRRAQVPHFVRRFVSGG
jgi:hypothetical protein